MERTTNEGARDVYDSFNILMRRKPKENNFKAVLETIRELMNTVCVVPDFLHDIILGYGDPGAAHYHALQDKRRSEGEKIVEEINFNDTFLSFEHLRHSFPSHEVTVSEKYAKDPKQLIPPFKVTFNAEGEKPGLIAEPYRIERRDPYPIKFPKKNSVLFTPTQIEAIRSGTNPGLTMVVGPPGTGKTDVAVQIISNLYHNFPEQRTLIVTHSNQALNQLFEKIMALDIDERHLVRLGHGEEALETEKDYSRYGRVNYVLGKRLELLDVVGKLQNSLEVKGDLAYTCETAGYFFLYQVISRWEKFLSIVRPEKLDGSTPNPEEIVPVDEIRKNFPFHRFFDDAPQPLFKGNSYSEDFSTGKLNDFSYFRFRHSNMW